LTSGTGAGALAAPSFVKFRDRLLFVSVLASFFVMMEPSPNELITAFGLLALLATGIAYPASAVPLLWLLLGLNIGGAVAALPHMSQARVATFVLVSVFLMAYCVYFVILLSENTARRLNLLAQAWIIAAVLACLAGIAGYFNVGGTRDLFTAFATRAKGTFNDPNVFGPFLVMPLLILAQGFLYGSSRRPVLETGALLVIVTGLFLSFSRAAWAHALGSLALFVLLTYATTQSSRLRLRITTVLVAGAALLTAALAGLASVPEVRDLLAERASLNQDYDTRAGGRFDNLRRGVDLVLENPLGVPPGDFARRFGEDPHNAYLHTFVAYGWLGGMSYLALVVATLWLGWSSVWARTPFQPAMIVIVASFTGVAGIGMVIHSDHWRHFFLLVALVWAVAAAQRRWLDGLRRAA
jgi:O-antigen ligase